MPDRSKCAERYFLTVIIASLALAVALPCRAQTYTTLVNFNVSNGDGPYYGPLIQGRDGNLWGTTAAGGAYDGGTIFKMTPSGTLTTVYSFCAQTNCADGYDPVAVLVMGKDGNFYGSTLMGGDENGCAYPQGCGVLFKITPRGVYTILHTFERSDVAAGPVGGLIQASNGIFYGDGGIDNGGMAVYKITSSGTYTELASWDLGVAGLPYGGVVQGTDGLLYGTTSIGGDTATCNDGCGTVVKIQTNGKKMVTLHSFEIIDGQKPIAGLVQASDGSFYGATSQGGGANVSACGFYPYDQCGTLFKITRSGSFTPLYNFCPEAGCFDGIAPIGTLIQATDGNLYGTTLQGGLGNGTIYQWNPNTQGFSLIYTFVGNDDTFGGLVQATNGKLYGTNTYGGNSPNCPYGCGAIFSLDMGLGPFVRPVTYSGKVGAVIEILGQGFNKSTTTVSFNGTTATRTVVSGNYLTAKVPTGATSGVITVTTGATMLTSDKSFTVLP